MVRRAILFEMGCAELFLSHPLRLNLNEVEEEVDREHVSGTLREAVGIIQGASRSDFFDEQSPQQRTLGCVGIDEVQTVYVDRVGSCHFIDKKIYRGILKPGYAANLCKDV